MLSERSMELPWLIANIGTPKRMLDIGSADAVYLGILYELCRDLYLCDTRPIKKTVPAYHFAGSAHNLPQAWTNHFDLVTCLSVLDHIGLDAYGNSQDDSMMEAVIREIERVLSPGGRLLLTVPYGRAQLTKHPGGGQRVFDLDTLLGLFHADTWRAIDLSVWKLDGDGYVDSDTTDAAGAEYHTWRAGACIALELVRL